MTHPTHPVHPVHPNHPPKPGHNNVPNAKLNMYVPLLFVLSLILIKRYANKTYKNAL